MARESSGHLINLLIIRLPDGSVFVEGRFQILNLFLDTCRSDGYGAEGADAEEDEWHADEEVGERGEVLVQHHQGEDQDRDDGG